MGRLSNSFSAGKRDSPGSLCLPVLAVCWRERMALVLWRKKEQLTSLSQLMGQQAGTSQGVMQAEGGKMLKDLFKL